EERERHYLNWARQGRVDGVVGVFFTLRATDFEPLLVAGVPVVRIESAKKRGGHLPLDDIFVDSQAAAFAVTRHLIAKGHKAIGMIAGKGGPQSVRIDGYALAMREAGLTLNVVIEEAFSEEGGLRAAQQLIGAAERPTAIFAANDLMAIGVMQAARERGLNIPSDLAVIGFDDISAAKLVTPALTTVAQFQYEMGKRAAQILMDRLNGSRTEPGTASEMPFRLIERDSA
ncbi:MAG: substrate-binding domain-containing protein, partial [Alphaproteobacteria bacterium]